MKGVLITFCVLLLAVAMLYMTATIAMYSSQIKGTPTEMSAFERMNMEYDTVSYGINRILANEKVNISISSGKIEGYSLLFKINQQTPAFNWTNKTEVLPSDPNSLYIHVGLQGTNGTVYYTGYLNRDSYNKLSMVNATNHTIVVVTIYPTANLTINYNLDMYLKSIMRLNSSASAEMSENSINTSTIYGKKLGKVVVFEN